ncbi:hypothetical protein STEG23_010467 [Scotinomys teguina]
MKSVFSEFTSVLVSYLDHFLARTSSTILNSLKSILFDIRIATPAWFLSPFDSKAFSQPFTLSCLIIMCSLREFFISSLRASITLKSFLVMNSSASSALVMLCSLSTSADLDSSEYRFPSPLLNGSLLNSLIRFFRVKVPAVLTRLALDSQPTAPEKLDSKQKRNNG